MALIPLSHAKKCVDKAWHLGGKRNVPGVGLEDKLGGGRTSANCVAVSSLIPLAPPSNRLRNAMFTGNAFIYFATSKITIMIVAKVNNR